MALISADDALEPVIVAIGGPTRAGKSSLARALNAHFGDAATFLTVEDFIIPDESALPRVSLGGHEIINWVQPWKCICHCMSDSILTGT